MLKDRWKMKIHNAEESVYLHFPKTFNIFDGCPNTGVRFAAGGAAMESVAHPMNSENAMDGYYRKESAVAIWKELVSAGFSDCFSTVCNEVDEKYRMGA